MILLAGVGVDFFGGIFVLFVYVLLGSGAPCSYVGKRYVYMYKN